MHTLIVVFRLQPGTDPQAYEEWARQTDLPIVRDLKSVSGFELYRVAGLLGSEEAAPFEYVEVIDVTDMEQFGADVAADTMRRVAAEFREFADNPVFMLTQSVEE